MVAHHTAERKHLVGGGGGGDDSFAIGSAAEHTVTTPVDRAESRDVLLQDEFALLLPVSRAAIETRRREGSFPIPELPSMTSVLAQSPQRTS